MLEYEKKLNLDKNWELMQHKNGFQFIYKMPLDVIEFISIYIVLKLLLSIIPDIQPWRITDIWKNILNVQIMGIDLIYFFVGLILYIYGRIYLSIVINQNHKAKNTDGSPTELLNQGFYSLRRHPMYGGFVICATSVLFSLRSLIGMVLIGFVIFLQYKNAEWEEERTLIPMFKDQYLEYMKKVPFKLFRYWEIVIIGIIMMINIIGLFF